jgi:acyl carrier protein
MKVRETIRQFIIDEFAFGDGENLTDETDLLEGGILPSMGILSTVTLIENQFGLKMSDEDINEENLKSINAIVAFVERKA